MLKSYENFLLHNASQITAVESSLRSITYFLPGRFPDSELAGEAIYSALNLLGLYHDSILVRLLSPHSMPRGLNGRLLSSQSQQQQQQQQQQQARASSSSSASSSFTAPPATYTRHHHTPSPHARYTHHFSDASPTYNVLARTLVILGYTELLAEMVARRKLSQKRAWDVVAGIESIKVVLRLALLHITGKRPTVQPPIPEREVDPAMLEEEERRVSVERAAGNGPTSSSLTDNLGHLGAQREIREGETSMADSWTGARTGYTRPTLQSLRSKSRQGSLTPPLPSSARRHPSTRHPLASTTSEPSKRTASQPLSSAESGSGSDSDETLVDSWTEKQINEYLLSRTLTPTDVKRPEDLVRPLRNTMAFSAEVVWILRPLIYVLALRRWGRTRKAPFVLSLVLEYVARVLRTRSLTSSSVDVGGTSNSALMMLLMGENPLLSLVGGLMGSGASRESRPISEVEKMEWEKRNRAFWWYLLRGPLWQDWTRPKLENLATTTENRPLLGIVGGIIKDYLPLVDDYYYYSAT